MIKMLSDSHNSHQLLNRISKETPNSSQRLELILFTVNSEAFIDKSVDYVHVLLAIITKIEQSKIRYLLLRNTQFFISSMKNNSVFKTYMNDDFIDAYVSSIRFIGSPLMSEKHSVFSMMIDANGISNKWFEENWTRLEDIRPAPSVSHYLNTKGLVLQSTYKRFFFNLRDANTVVNREVCLWLAESILFHERPESYFSSIRFDNSWAIFTKNLEAHGLKDLVKCLDDKLDGKITNWLNSVSRSAA